MQYIEALGTYDGDKRSVFLAGGITGCPDWQAELVGYLKDEDVVLLNPRRANFPIDDPDASVKQITWEYEQLRKADSISFWFPKDTICPIVLYELGAWSMTEKPLFVGVHPEYQRRQDVEIQTKLVRPAIEVGYDLGKLSEQVRTWLNETL